MSMTRYTAGKSPVVDDADKTEDTTKPEVVSAPGKSKTVRDANSTTRHDERLYA